MIMLKQKQLKDLFDDELEDYKEMLFFEMKKPVFSRMLVNAFFDAVKVLEERKRFNTQMMLPIPETA